MAATPYSKGGGWLMANKRGRPKFQGCNEDCFHCPYSDCKKPAKQMKPDNSIAKAIRVGESQSRMFTLEFQRKYYRR